MGDAALVRGRHRVGERNRPRAAAAASGNPPARDQLVQRLAVDQLQRQEQAAVRSSTEWIVTMLGWLSAATARASRSKRSRRSGSRGAARREHLQRDAATELGVLGHDRPRPCRPRRSG